MKVGLLSFHNAYNYGACLQAYALQEAIGEMGAECEYIDYINERRAEGYKMSVRILNAIKERDIKGTVKNICGVPFVWLRKCKFDRFYKTNLKKTKNVYRTSADARALESQYDKFVIGSDQVWNAEHNGTDGAYFLDFVKDDSKKISYSSSFGMANIPDNLQLWYANNLKHIECLSTRERCGVNIIEKLIGRKAHLVLDPVFLLSADYWERFIKKDNEYKKYTFFYLNAKFKIEDFEKKTGWKAGEKHILSASVSFKDFVKKNQKVTFAMSPAEFLQQIYDAELIVTTSFHCLAFSILFHKRFVVILSGDSGRDERLRNLLKITGLESRIFSPDMGLPDIYSAINYCTVEKNLDVYRKYSSDYLSTAIYEGKSSLEKVKIPSLEWGAEE